MHYIQENGIILHNIHVFYQYDFHMRFDPISTCLIAQLNVKIMTKK